MKGTSIEILNLTKLNIKYLHNMDCSAETMAKYIMVLLQGYPKGIYCLFSYSRKTNSHKTNNIKT